MPPTSYGPSRSVLCHCYARAHRTVGSYRLAACDHRTAKKAVTGWLHVIPGRIRVYTCRPEFMLTCTSAQYNTSALALFLALELVLHFAKGASAPSISAWRSESPNRHCDLLSDAINRNQLFIFLISNREFRPSFPTHDDSETFESNHDHNHNGTHTQCKRL